MKNQKIIRKYESVVILYNIRSTQNVGSMFRTADAAGVSAVYLVGYTPAPIDRFGRKRIDIIKASLGAEESVPWVQYSTLAKAIKNLREHKFQIVALEQSSRAINYRKYKVKSNVALIVGNEVSGLPPRVLKSTDAIVEIPMRGKKESLNVSVALGIALFQILAT